MSAAFSGETAQTVSGDAVHSRLPRSDNNQTAAVKPVARAMIARPDRGSDN